jgi:hypothetical protein
MRRNETTQRILVALVRTQILIISEQGTEVPHEFGANKCSVETGSGVKEVFALTLRGGTNGKIGQDCTTATVRRDLISNHFRYSSPPSPFYLLNQGCRHTHPIHWPVNFAWAQRVVC